MKRWQDLAPRSRALVALLAASLLATLWAASQSSPEAVDSGVALAPRKAVARAAPSVAGAAASAPAAWPALPVARSPWPRLAQATAWGPPPAPPMPMAAKAKTASTADDAPAGPPPAPPFPYTLIGRFEDGPLTQAMLSSPRRTLGVKAKDVIDGQWRVDAVDATGMTLTWLPSGQTVTVTLPTRPS